MRRRSPRVARALQRVVARTVSTERADRSFFIWRDVPTFPPHELRVLGVINGFLRWLPFRLVVTGEFVSIERRRSDWRR